MSDFPVLGPYFPLVFSLCIAKDERKDGVIWGVLRSQPRLTHHSVV